MVVFPAIDVRRGRCVRLERGDAERETVYDADPVRVAERLTSLGASWVHVVDLDAALGDGSNRELIRSITARVGTRIQTGGGLRSEADLAEVFESGVARAVIGTAAVEDPELVTRAIARWGAERIAVGIDARGETPAVRGWTEGSDRDLFALGRQMVRLGARTLIYTDIARDGMLAGPNVEQATRLAAQTGAEVIVSGGVASPADLDAVDRAARAYEGDGAIGGVIVGKAIYEERLNLAEVFRRFGG